MSSPLLQLVAVAVAVIINLLAVLTMFQLVVMQRVMAVVLRMQTL
jgi:hypothetical protein